MTFKHKDLQEMWENMLAAQKAKGGFTLTVRELFPIFKVTSTNSIFHRLRLLVDAGFVVTHEEGSKTFYRAKDVIE